MSTDNLMATRMLSDWYYNNASKIYALDVNKRMAILKAFEFFAKRYETPTEQITTEIELEDSDTEMKYQKNEESLIDNDLGKLLDDLETIDF
jgi:hypothetical protein